MFSSLSLSVSSFHLMLYFWSNFSLSRGSTLELRAMACPGSFLSFPEVNHSSKTLDKLTMIFNILGVAFLLNFFSSRIHMIPVSNLIPIHMGPLLSSQAVQSGIKRLSHFFPPCICHSFMREHRNT